MDDLDFLQVWSYVPIGTLTVILPDGTTASIDGIDPNIIHLRCPLLALSFEEGARGRASSSIEASSRTLAICFLRYLYGGDYLVFDKRGEEMPCSILLHAQLYRLAEIFDVPDLQVAAHINIMRETELSCSRPHPPDDLCEAIRYLYTHLSSQRPLIDTILHYCVSCFTQHRLATTLNFRQLAFELSAFHNDLARTNFERNFEDDGAAEIVRLPVREPEEHSAAKEGRIALGDFLFELWADSSLDLTTESRPHKRQKSQDTTDDTYTAPYRPKPKPKLPEVWQKVMDTRPNVGRVSNGTDSSSDEDGFTLVHRPRDKVIVVEESEDKPQRKAKDKMLEKRHDVSPEREQEPESDSEWSVVSKDDVLPIGGGLRLPNAPNHKLVPYDDDDDDADTLLESLV